MTYEEKLLESFLQGFTEEFNKELIKESGRVGKGLGIIRKELERVQLMKAPRAGVELRTLRSRNIEKVISKDAPRSIIRVKGPTTVIPDYAADQGSSALRRNVFKRQKAGLLPGGKKTVKNIKTWTINQ